MSNKIAFIAYETPYAPCGGIAAVMKFLPEYMQRASGGEAVVITPFHHRIERTKELRQTMESIGELSVPFGGETIKVEILKLRNRNPYYFIRALDDRFFAGQPNPYLVGDTPEAIANNLLRDSLLFGKCTAEALSVIDPVSGWTLMMQDWETAATALALASRRSDYKMYITLHNSYDSKATDSDLQGAGIDPSSCPPYYPQPFVKAETILARALQVVRSPVFTVSEQFALDLVHDKLHTSITASHLQGLLKGRLLGVNNGLFTELSLNGAVLERARRGETGPLKKWKFQNRKAAVEALLAYSPTAQQPVWGDINKFEAGDDSVCWFLMAGRDDPRQKGYDIAAAAARKFLDSGQGDARFFFFPVPGDEGIPGLTFLKELAESFPEKVIVLPFLWREGFIAVLQGASFGIMPSFYEPFGMANEFYLKGTVGIGRATGGIVQQIIPLRAAGSFSQAAEARSIRWHSESAHPTGILFREADNIESLDSEWVAINAARYKIGGMPDRVSERSRLTLFKSAALELSVALIDAVTIYRQRQDLYCRMLVEGIDYIGNMFSWERAAQEYHRNIQ